MKLSSKYSGDQKIHTRLLPLRIKCIHGMLFLPKIFQCIMDIYVSYIWLYAIIFPEFCANSTFDLYSIWSDLCFVDRSICA